MLLDSLVLNPLVSVSKGARKSGDCPHLGVGCSADSMFQ